MEMTFYSPFLHTNRKIYQLVYFHLLHSRFLSSNVKYANPLLLLLYFSVVVYISFCIHVISFIYIFFSLLEFGSYFKAHTLPLIFVFAVGFRVMSLNFSSIRGTNSTRSFLKLWTFSLGSFTSLAVVWQSFRSVKVKKHSVGGAFYIVVVSVVLWRLW